MKLRLLAASVAAVGMMAGSSLADDIAIGAEYFDLYAGGDVITNMAAKATAADYTGNDGAADYDLIGQWSSGPNDLSAIVDDSGTLSLTLDTEGDVVTNAFLDAATINGVLDDPGDYSDENATASGEVTLWASVSFVPSDEIEDSLQDGVDIDNGDLKFALYAYEHEVTESVDDGEGNFSDVTTMVTNLVVYHSFYRDVGGEDPELVFTNEVIAAAIDFGEAKDVYVTMKRVPGSSETFFKVTVESEITSPLACTDAGLVAGPIAYPSAGGVWFRTVNADGGEAVGAINFSGTGSVGGLAATYATVPAGSDFTVSWVGSENVVVTNETLGVEAPGTSGDFAPNTELTFYPTVGAITNVAGEAVANLPSFTVFVSADTNIVILAGEELVPAPTVITVAQAIGGHGHSVSNGNFQAVSGVPTPITITADQGYVVAQIVTNGAAVADALGETSVTFDAVFSDLDGANNSIVATFAKDNAWFVEPFVRNSFESDVATENTQASAIDEANDVIAFGTAPGASTAGIVQYSLAKMTNDFGKVTGYEYAKSQSDSHNGECWGRSLAAVPRFEAIVSCNYTNAGVVVVSPYGGPWLEEGDVSYTVPMDMGESGLPAPKLSPITVNRAGTFLYGSDSDGTKIYRFAIVPDAHDATKIGSLEYVASWEFVCDSNIRGIGVGTFNGNDVVYADKTEDYTRCLWTLDVATGTLVDTGAPIFGGDFQLYTTGIADGTPRLVIAGGPNIHVYSLAADGSLLSATPVAVYATWEYSYPIFSADRLTFGVTPVDDESRIVIASYARGGKIAYSIVEKKPANLIVRGTFDQGVTTDDRSVAFGAAASETFTAPAGETLISVSVNGVAQQVAEGATSFTYEAAELTGYVYIDMQSSPPVYTATWTGSQDIIVTNTYDGVSYEMDSAIFSADVLQGTVLSFYPAVGTITNVTIGGVEQTGFDPACYSITVVSDTNLVVLAGEAAQPAQKPAWAADSGDGSVTDKYWAWAEDHAAGQNLYADGADYSAQYLLNVDANVAATLHIDSIEITDEGTKIVVSAAAGNADINLETINGVLDVYVGNAVGSLTKKSIPAKNLDFVNGKAEVIIPAQDGKFVKAGVDYSAPAASITEIE